MDYFQLYSHLTFQWENNNNIYLSDMIHTQNSKIQFLFLNTTFQQSNLVNLISQNQIEFNILAGLTVRLSFGLRPQKT